MKHLSLDSAHQDESNESYIIKIESLNTEILAILQLLITYIYIGILYIKCPGHVLDITKFMSMDGTVLDVPSIDIIPFHYQHCPNRCQIKQSECILFGQPEI